MPAPSQDHASDLGVAAPEWLGKLTDSAADAGEDVDAALALAVEYGRRLDPAGGGSTATRWAVLATVAGANLTVARVLEAHTDALTIIAESGDAQQPAGSWGVFAAEAPGTRVVAHAEADVVRLSGTKAWCSLGDRLDSALVTAHLADGARQLFRVALRRPDVRPAPADGWVARGLRTVTSVAIDFDDSPAQPVGEPGWYLTRPGFAWGGIGVAACWYGAARALAGSVLGAATRRPADLSAMHAGAADVAVYAAGCALADAAWHVDGGTASGADGALLALRVRAIVAAAAETVLRHAAHALGPAPLAFDGPHAARVADLELYVRQHHAERDLAALGRQLSERSGD